MIAFARGYDYSAWGLKAFRAADIEYTIQLKTKRTSSVSIYEIWGNREKKG